jgi:hypothetical protein
MWYSCSYISHLILVPKGQLCIDWHYHIFEELILACISVVYIYVSLVFCVCGESEGLQVFACFNVAVMIGYHLLPVK